MRGFFQKEEGSLTLLSLIFFLMMFMIGGLAVDMLVFENNRTRLQNVSDRATLAAADLEQDLTPNEVVQSYFAKEGLGDYLNNVIVTDNGASKSVEVQATRDLSTMFMRMVGTEQMMAPAGSTAMEAAGEVEISLVLDNSGSMNNTDGDSLTRLDELKDAVAQFLSIMYPDGSDPYTTVSIVPYAAQVNAGPLLTNLLNVTAEHSYSDCIEFLPGQFGALSLDQAATYDRSAHFSMFETDDDPTRFMCRPTAEQEIYVMGSDPATIQIRVDALSAEGNTSLDLAAKWGAALLDPGSNNIVQALISEPAADVLSEHSDRPVPYTDAGTVKALILMTDGINTYHQQMAAAYKDGSSDLWRTQGSIAEIHAVTGLANLPPLADLVNAGIDVNMQRTWYTRGIQEGSAQDHDSDGTTNEQFWTPDVWINGELVLPEQWASAVMKGPGPAEPALDWVEVWDDITPTYYADVYIYEPFNDSAARDAFMANLLTTISSTTKDTQLDALCDQAKTQGLTVYTIGLNVNSHSVQVLTDCASNANFYLDATTDDLTQAFESIAQSIMNQKLRLIH